MKAAGVVLLLMLVFCSVLCIKPADRVVFPYSQWTVGTAGDNITWRYAEGVTHNNSFIKIPDADGWEPWMQAIRTYRKTLSQSALEPPYLFCRFPEPKGVGLHFDSFAYQLALQPGEQIAISLKARSPNSAYSAFVTFDLKIRGEEKSYVVREKLTAGDSLSIPRSSDWLELSLTVSVPDYDAERFAIAPLLRIVQPDAQASELFVKDIQMKTNGTRARRALQKRIEAYAQRHAEGDGFAVPAELEWTLENFVMGFVFLWDHTFWDADGGTYRVDEYCRTIKREFGGIQSVILWHSYPNLGVDERNQFDMLRGIPGGTEALRKMVQDFHRNGVKVFLTYNPWDLDTRRPEEHDFIKLAKILRDSDADGLFLDTWRSAKGSISVFDVDSSIRDQAAKLGKTVAFSAEILPTLKDLYGPDALTCSWGQEIEPFHYTDLSLLTWLMPDHRQHFIKRMAKDKKQILAHAWLNGQGIQVWENIFGTMNFWTAADRKALRKMNAVWQTFGEIYRSDDYTPFFPTMNEHIIASRWANDQVIITQLVDTLKSESRVRMPVADETASYYDLWNGRPLPLWEENGRLFVEIAVNDFGCLLQTDQESEELRRLLAAMHRETQAPLPDRDEYAQECSLKEPLKFRYRVNDSTPFAAELLAVKGGRHTFTCTHILREGQCYPNMDARDNHDLVIEQRDGAQRVIHTHTENLEAFQIMPSVVTNRQFAAFLSAANYRPRFSENFLKHWHGRACPPERLDEPVVYVSLEDARAFAEWAGMRLPTEWQWQLAAETLKDAFVFNQVFEWNESERFDGFNRFVTLRGGSKDWMTGSSWWYFPGALYGETAGGAQPHTSHVKYFLMNPAIDRAATIGFRCVKR